jgi:exopolysaccharide production protein ExoQ
VLLASFFKDVQLFRPEQILIERTSEAYPLAGAALVIPTFGLLFPLGLAPLLAVIAVAVLAVSFGRVWSTASHLWGMVVLLLLLALWGAISSLWSILPGHSLSEAGRLLLLSVAGVTVVLAGCGLDDAGRTMVGRAAVIGLLGGLAIMAAELATNFSIRQLLSTGRVIVLPNYDRGATVLSLACWIAALYLIETGYRSAAAAVFSLTALVVYLMFSLSAFLAMLVAPVVFALGWWRARLTALLLGGGFALLAAVIPFLQPDRAAILWLRHALPGLRDSATHRLVIWRFASDRWHERPLLGWGMDASRAMPGGKTEIAAYLGLPPELHLTGAVMPLHPHDAALQWWLELGVVGAMIGTAIVLFTLWKIAVTPRLSRAGRAVALAVVTSAFLPLLLNFGVWQGWWESSLWLVAALVAALVAEPERGLVAGEGFEPPTLGL